MATLQEVIRRITIFGKTEGVDAASASLERLSGAQAGVAVASERTEKATLSLERRTESLQRSLDAEYRAQQNLARANRDIAAARAQGLISAQRQVELSQLAAAKFNQETLAATRTAGALKMLKDVSMGFVGGIGAGLAFGSLTQLPSAISNTVERLGNTANAAQTIGITTNALQELRFAARLSDVEINTLDEAMGKFSINLGKAATLGGPLSDILKANKVAISGDLLTDLERYADLIKNATNQEERNLLVTTAFGKSAQEMGRLFEKGGAGIKEWAQQARAAGAVLDESLLERARELDDQMEALKPQLEAVGAEFAVLVMPAQIAALQTFNTALIDTRDLLTAITNLDLEKIGQLASSGTFKNLANFAGNPGGFIAGLINGGQADQAQRTFDASGSAFRGGWGSRPTAEIVISGGNTDTVIPTKPDSGAKAYDKLLESSDRRIAQLKAEAEALGMAGVAAEAFKNYTDLLTQAQSAGIEITPDVIEKLHEQADAIAMAQEELAGLQMDLANRTPWEVMEDSIDRLDERLANGTISWRTYNNEMAKSAQSMVQGYASAAGDVLGNVEKLTDALGLQGRQAFETQKALSIAKAVVSGGEAIVNSYAAGTAIGGPIGGAIFAGIAAAATAAQIASIASTSYQSKSLSNATGNGSAAAAAPSQGVGGTQQAISLTVRGSGNINVDDFAEQLAESIRDGGQGNLIRVIRAA
jgi:hypothetical protein